MDEYTIEEIHLSLVNGQRRQMVDQIKKYGLYNFFSDYKIYIEGLYSMAGQYSYFADCVISFNRINNR